MFIRNPIRLAATISVLFLAACGQEPAPPPVAGNADSPAVQEQPAVQATSQDGVGGSHTNAYFGAVHVHTSYSFDAYTNGTVTTPADAYAWARGAPIPGADGGPMMQIRSPLDFYAVSDHAEWMGVFRLMGDPDSPMSKHPMAARITSDDQNEAMQAFAEILREYSMGNADPSLSDPEVSRSVWSDIVKAADEAYVPGEFTTFPAFEWSANPDMMNLHRVVVFRDSDKLPELAFSAHQSTHPEALWAWMEEQRAAGATLTAIPHNGNASDGLMFALVDSQGRPLDEKYIATRMRNERVYEITQIKGTSETHPELSPNDEFAGFEIWDYTLSADALRPTNRQGSYARQALLDGLAMAAEGRGNPFQYGFIGDTDTHNAAASHEEDNYTGKFSFEIDPAHRLLGLEGQPEHQVQQVREFSSGGLAGVWAEANTREAIFDAIQRRETFATTGPKIRLRFFASWDLSNVEPDSAEWVAKAYEAGVPMGGTLDAAPQDRQPVFMAWAIKDPDGAGLERLQLVKGWIDATGEQHEDLIDLAWSGGREPDADGKLPAVADDDPGRAQLAALWVDSDFDASRHAFYYLRVIAVPTPRWSTLDAERLGVEIPAGLPRHIQERAWSSPIWYTP